MKHTTSIFFICIFFGFSGISKETQYFDKKGTPTTKSEAFFYRIFDADEASHKYIVMDYYMDGVLASKGFFLSNKFEIKDGYFTEYYTTGQKKAEGQYKNNLKIDTWHWWYPEGQPMQEIMYQKPKKEQMQERALVKNYWDAEGNQHVEDGYGLYQTLTFDGYHGDDFWVESYGEVYKGLKEGYWEGYKPNGDVLYEEFYIKGDLLHGESADEEGNIYVYENLRKLPTPSGGLDNFINFINKNLKYPLLAASGNIEGTVLVQFLITKEGSLDDLRVVKSLGWGCDEEAERIIQHFGEWEPGMYRGQLRNSRVVLPIIFKL